jgi:DNA polymerase II small subunit/DNA polymerase delta subunit B
MSSTIFNYLHCVLINIDLHAIPGASKPLENALPSPIDGEAEGDSLLQETA